ncbi:N-methyl-L-tryptophan oxidase [Chloroflexi bacterium TSY]|nr:N-methyl-L-tryptophan oxidase [Chloroflexi bacterium TSY]
MKTNYDYIILGCGGVGGGAAYWLARRAGADVLGLEQFELGHHKGGSQDHSRIIRLTYHDAKYTALTPHTYDAWATLEEESAVQVVTNTGSIEWANAHSSYTKDVQVYADAMEAANIPYERFGADEVMRRYPQFKFEQEVDALWQEKTGIADAAKGNAAHIGTARYHGATILDHTQVTDLHPFDGGVDVITNRGTFTCKRLIITAGAWMDNVLESINLNFSLTVTQEQVTYYATPNLKEFAVGRFPIFINHSEHVYYGFPVYGEVATKAAIDASGAPVTTDTRTFEGDPVKEKQLTDWLAHYIPSFIGPRLYTKTCLYTMPKDRDFIIDCHPDHPQIIICNGAGHVYKFSSLVGKILSELAIDGKTQYPIGDFTMNRPAITDPSFEASFHI